MNEPGRAPAVEKFEPARDEPQSPWGRFAAAAIAAVAAVLCFTPLWDELAPGDRHSGRRAGFSNLLHDIGPFWVAAFAAALAVLFAVSGVLRMLAARKADG